MKHLYTHITLLLLVTLLNIKTGLAQSPWVMKQKGYSHIAIGTIPSYDQVFDGGQNSLNSLNGEITELSFQSYTEYGITDRIGVIAEIPLRYVSATVIDTNMTDRESGNITGLGNIGLGVKYNLHNQKYVITAQARVNLPISASDEVTGLKTDYNTTSIIPTISIGRGSKKWYFYAYTGISYYGDNLSSNFVYGIEYGYRLHEKLLTILTLNGKESFRNGDRVYSDHFEETHFYVNDQFYHSLAFKLTYEINENIGLNGSTNLISVRANRLPFQSPFSLAFYYKW